MNFINSNPYLLYAHSQPDSSLAYPTAAAPPPIPMEYLYGQHPHVFHDPRHPHQTPLPPHAVYYAAIPFEDPDSTVPRPRLTKEQVSVLEAQFQAQSKPNSKMKRQLALQTNLTLPRVANWFQNRRAKAKQQKRQEEYEQKLSMEMAEKKEASASDGTSKEPITNSNSSQAENDPRTNDANALTKGESSATRAEARPSDTKTDSPSQDGQRVDNDSPSSVSPTNVSASQSSHESWPASSPSGSPPEDSESVNPENLGIGSEDQSLRHNSVPITSTTERTRTISDLSSNIQLSTSAPTYGNLLTPEHEVTPTTNQQHGLSQTSEDITPALTSGDADVASTSSSANQKSPFLNKGADIARRRRRPRPAAIGTNLARGHPGPASAAASMPSSGLHSLRQVKSTHNLGVDYRSKHHSHAGIRKVSSSQRSPLNWTSSVDSSWLNTSSGADISSSVPPLSANCFGSNASISPEHPHSAILPPTPHDSSSLDHYWDGSNTLDSYMSNDESQGYVQSPPITANALDMSNWLPQQTPQLITSVPAAPTQSFPQSAPAYKTSFLPEETDFSLPALPDDWLNPSTSLTIPSSTFPKTFDWPDQSVPQDEQQSLSHGFSQPADPVSPEFFNGLYNLPDGASGPDETVLPSPKDRVQSPAAVHSDSLKSELLFSGPNSFPMYSVLYP